MALNVGELFAALTLNTDSFKKGLDTSHKDATGWGSRVKGIFKGAALAIGASLVAVGAAAVAVGIKSLDNAEEQEIALRRVSKAFGKNASDVQKWAEKNALSFGVQDDALETSVATYAEFAKNAGLSTKQATDGAEATAKRASEIAAVTGKSYDEVFTALQKGAQGATKGLKEYGVAVDQNAIKEQAMKMGLYDGKGALDVHAKTLATQALILQQTASYTDAATQADSSYTKGKMQLGVVIDTIMDTIGAAVMAVVNAAMPSLIAAFQAFSDWTTANGPAIQALIDTVFQAVGAAIAWVGEHVVPLLAAAFKFFVENDLPIIVAAFQWVTTNVLPALGAAFDFITTTVIPALAGVFDWVRTNILPPVMSVFDTITTVILPALGEAFRGVQQWISDNWPLISKIVGQVGGAVKAAFDIIANVIKTVAPIIVDIGRVVFPIVGDAATVLLNVLSGAFDAIGVVWQTASDIASTVVNAIKQAWGPLSGFFSSLWNSITGIIKGGINFVIGAINGMIRALNSIQIHIPGFDTPVGKIAAFDWNGLNLGQIPYLASGTPFFKGGLAMLGEQGPELAALPRGTRVFNAGQTRDLLSGSDGAQGGPLIGMQIIQGTQPGDVERETRRALRRQALQWQLEGR